MEYRLHPVDSSNLRDDLKSVDSVPFWWLFLSEEQSLCSKLSDVNYGPKVKFVLQPLDYAIEVHRDFLFKYCNSPKKVLFLGMNPGPWGMMQNGVPFGESSSVRDFLRVVGSVATPRSFHPKRPILGLSCQRSEVSGKRFWSFASELGAGDPQRFFENAFVYNFFPFCLLDESGKNVTPPELKGLASGVREYIERCCEESLLNILKLLQVEVAVCIGRYAQAKISKFIEKAGYSIKVVYLPHPSPRNPASNRDWVQTARSVITSNDLGPYFSDAQTNGPRPCNVHGYGSFNEKWMEVAIGMAEKALAKGEVPVGCIFVRGDEILAEGRNDVNRTRNATRHAEMVCVDAVLERFKDPAVFKDVTVVVTVEPCIMCAGALHDLDVKSIVYGCPNDRFGGCGSVFDVAAVHGTPVPVVSGLFASKAMELLKTFYMGVNPNAPPSKVKTRKKTELPQKAS